jgi:hypothetical protein
VLGRFIQPDPGRADDNLYEYSVDSPVTKTDPSGGCTEAFLLSILGGPEVGAGATALCWLAVGAFAMLAYHPTQILTTAIMRVAQDAIRNHRRMTMDCAVIGENVSRVRLYAMIWNCDTYGGFFPSGRQGEWFSRQSDSTREGFYMNDNRRWIIRMMAEHRVIIDLGPRSGYRITSIYYRMEHTVTLGYPGLIRYWVDARRGRMS